MGNPVLNIHIRVMKSALCLLHYRRPMTRVLWGVLRGWAFSYGRGTPVLIIHIQVVKSAVWLRKDVKIGFILGGKVMLFIS